MAFFDTVTSNNFKAGKKTNINYVSADPGMGKTLKTLEYLVELMEQGHHYLFYVAPSIDLGSDIRVSLARKLAAKGWSSKKIDRRLRLMNSRTIQGSTVLLKLQMVFSAREGSQEIPFTPGCLVILTHQTFYDLTEEVFSATKKNRSVVFFDEVYKSIEETVGLTMREEEHEKFLSYFKSSDYRNSRYTRLEPRSKPTSAEIKALTKNIGARRQLPAIEELIKKVLNPNLEVYTYAKKSRGSKSQVDTYTVIVPSKVFVGFKTVVIMSAFFEDSQMFHLLNLDDSVRMVDATEDYLLHFRYLKMRALNRYSYLTIIPLTESETVLSQNLLDKDVLINRPLLEKLVTVMEKNGFTFNDGVELISSIKGTGSIVEGKLAKLRDKLMSHKNLAVDPFKWYASSASRILRKLPDEDRTQPIVFVKKGKGHGALFEHPDWRVMNEEARGSNQYIESTVGAYLKPLNPPPTLGNFLTTRLTKQYKVDDDWVIASCIQCLMRTAIRKTKETTKVYFIVTDTAIAKEIKNKLGGTVHIDRSWLAKTGHFSSMRVGLRDLAKQIRKKARQSRVTTYSQDHHERNKSNPVYRERARLTAAKARAKAKGDAVRVSELERQLAGLRPKTIG